VALVSVGRYGGRDRRSELGSAPGTTRDEKEVLNGTVTAFHFVNPHSVVEFEVTDDKGNLQEWKAEMTNPAHLKGWTATSLEPGDVVTVTGFRAKSGAPYLWVTSLSSSNGVELKAPK